MCVCVCVCVCVCWNIEVTLAGKNTNLTFAKVAGKVARGVFNKQQNFNLVMLVINNWIIMQIKTCTMYVGMINYVYNMWNHDTMERSLILFWILSFKLFSKVNT